MRLPLALLALSLALPASAAAAPPPNDNYLSSTTINRPDGALANEYRASVDTAEATTQPDMFNPDKDGLPLGGGDPEQTTCDDGTSFGKTAWWDFRPPSAGGIQIKADGGFDVVVAVYTWSSSTSKITGRVLCQNAAPGSEDVVIDEVRKGTNYTIQVGGANGAGGPLNLLFDYSPDTDGDGILDDAPDECRKLPGIERFGGCPPELRAAPRISYSVSGTSLRVTSLSIDDVPKGARAEVRCGRCGGGRVTRRARRAGTLRLPGFAGRTVPAGDRIEVRVTLGKTGTGRYRHGAIGKFYRWPVEPGRLGRRQTRCIRPGVRTLSRCR